MIYARSTRYLHEQGGRRTAGTGAEKQLKGVAESRIWGGNPKKAGFSFLRLPVYHAGKLSAAFAYQTGYEIVKKKTE